MTLEATPTIVNPAGITHGRLQATRSRPPTSTPALLQLLASRRMVLLIHQGGQQTRRRRRRLSNCAGFTGEIVDIVAGPRPGVRRRRLRAHAPVLLVLAAELAGKPSVVTSAGSNGQLVTDIDYTLDRRPAGSPVAAHNVIVENGVRNPDGAWQRPARAASYATRIWSTRAPR